MSDVSRIGPPGSEPEYWFDRRRRECEFAFPDDLFVDHVYPASQRFFRPSEVGYQELFLRTTHTVVRWAPYFVDGDRPALQLMAELLVRAGLIDSADQFPQACAERPASVVRRLAEAGAVWERIRLIVGTAIDTPRLVRFWYSIVQPPLTEPALTNFYGALEGDPEGVIDWCLEQTSPPTEIRSRFGAPPVPEPPDHFTAPATDPELFLAGPVPAAMQLAQPQRRVHIRPPEPAQVERQFVAIEHLLSSRPASLAEDPEAWRELVLSASRYLGALHAIAIRNGSTTEGPFSDVWVAKARDKQSSLIDALVRSIEPIGSDDVPGRVRGEGLARLFIYWGFLTLSQPSIVAAMPGFKQLLILGCDRSEQHLAASSSFGPYLASMVPSFREIVSSDGLYAAERLKMWETLAQEGSLTGSGLAAVRLRFGVDGWARSRRNVAQALNLPTQFLSPRLRRADEALSVLLAGSHPPSWLIFEA